MLLLLVAVCVTVNTAKPNIVIMFMDDMGWGDIGVHGNPAKETPNIDKMAAEGMLFPSFYAAAPLCSPSRASIMTGRLPIRNGFYTTNAHARNAYTPQNIVGGISETEVLLPQILKQGGYRSKVIGKWHLGQRQQYLPLNRGFDEFFGSSNCHFGGNDVDTPNMPVYKDSEMIGRYYTNFTIKGGRSNLTQLFIKEATTFIQDQVEAATPFLLYWTPDATHQPTYASEMFKGKSVRGNYGDAVMELDYGVGVILDKLRELKVEQNTFVFFSSDNGAEGIARQFGGSNGPLLCGKQTTFEGGMREPGIGWWPGTIPAGHVSHQLGTTMDLMVTAVKLAGLSLPQNRQYDGVDLSGVLTGGDTFTRPVFYYRGNEMFAARVGAYKAHYWTWTHKHYNFCPGQYVLNVTTPNQVNCTDQPIVFNVERDIGEKYKLGPRSAEYRNAMKVIRPIVEQHKATMIAGEPQLNYCDKAVMNWAPHGCEKIDYCLPVPKSNIKLCSWDH